VANRYFDIFSSLGQRMKCHSMPGLSDRLYGEDRRCTLIYGRCLYICQIEKSSDEKLI
jgi:hypothetical protein